MQRWARAGWRWLWCGTCPRDIGGAVLLGLLAGLTLGWNYTFAAVVLAALVWNVHALVFVAVAALAYGLGTLVETPLEWLGRLVLDETPLAAALATVEDSLLVALLDLDRYRLAGGLAAAAVLGVPLSHALARAIRAGTDRGQLEAQPVPVLSSRRCLRRHGAWLGLIWLAAVAGASIEVLPRHVAERLMEDLAELHAAPVTAARCDVSLWEGRVTFEDLALADTQDARRDRLRVERATADVDAAALWRGRFVVRHLHLTGLATDVPRRAGAEALMPPAVSLPTQPVPLTETRGPRTSSLALENYVAGWDQCGPRLTGFERAVAWVDALADLEKQPLGARTWGGTGTARAGRRAALRADAPRIVIERLQATELPAAWALGPRATLELTGLSSRPHRDDPTATWELVLPAVSARLDGNLDLVSAAHRHSLRVAAYELPLAGLVDAGRLRGLVELGRGRLTLDGQGWLTATQLHAVVVAEVVDFEARVVCPQPLAGLAPELWNDGLRTVDRFRAELVVDGPWSQPTLSADPYRVVAQWKHQLRAEGAHALVAAIDASQKRPTPPAAPTVAAPSTTAPVATAAPVTPPAPKPASAPPTLAAPKAPPIAAATPAVVATQPPASAVAAKPPVTTAPTTTAATTSTPATTPAAAREPAASTEPTGEAGFCLVSDGPAAAPKPAAPTPPGTLTTAPTATLAAPLAAATAKPPAAAPPAGSAKTYPSTNLPPLVVKSRAEMLAEQQASAPPAPRPGPINLVLGFDDQPTPYPGQKASAVAIETPELAVKGAAVTPPTASATQGPRPLSTGPSGIQRLLGREAPATAAPPSVAAASGEDRGSASATKPAEPERTTLFGGPSPLARLFRRSEPATDATEASPRNELPADEDLATTEPQGEGRFTRWTKDVTDRLTGLFARRPEPAPVTDPFADRDRTAPTETASGSKTAPSSVDAAAPTIAGRRGPATAPRGTDGKLPERRPVEQAARTAPPAPVVSSDELGASDTQSPRTTSPAPWYQRMWR